MSPTLPARSTMVDDILATARVFAIPMTERFRRTMVREGLVIDGPAGAAEFAPFTDYDDRACVPWLHAAVDTAVRNWPDAVRGRVETNVTVPVVTPAAGRRHRRGVRLPHRQGEGRRPRLPAGR